MKMIMIPNIKTIRFNDRSICAGIIFFLFVSLLACKPSERDDPDSANWDIAALDVAKNVNYLSRVEKDVILEMNKVRTDPQKYAQLCIEPELQYYDGKM